MDYTTTYSGDLNPAAALGIFSAIMIPMLITGLAFYVYMSWALMTIANKTNTPNAWLAWIPIANLYLMTQIAQVPWWTFLLVFLAWIPIIGSLGVLALTVWWWWKICERRNRPGWWSLLIGFVPVVNLIMLGVLAWSEAEGGSSTPPQTQQPAQK